MLLPNCDRDQQDRTVNGYAVAVEIAAVRPTERQIPWPMGEASMNEGDKPMGLAGDLAAEVESWTANRRAAVVTPLVPSDGSVQVAVSKGGLTAADVTRSGWVT